MEFRQSEWFIWFILPAREHSRRRLREFCGNSAGSSRERVSPPSLSHVFSPRSGKPPTEMRNYLRIRRRGGTIPPLEETLRHTHREDDKTPKERNHAINIPGRFVVLEKPRREIRRPVVLARAGFSSSSCRRLFPLILKRRLREEGPSAERTTSTTRRRVGPPLRGPAERP